MKEKKETSNFHIKFDKKNIVRSILFCIFALFAIILLIQALILAIMGNYKPTNRFLIAFPILCIIIDFFIGKAIINHSKIDF